MIPSVIRLLRLDISIYIYAWKLVSSLIYSKSSS